MNKRKLLSSIGLITLLLFASSTPTFAQVTNGVYNVGSDDVATFGWITTLFSSILGIIARMIGVGAFVMLVVGSFQYLVSGGDGQKLEQAKKTISYAITGLALIFISWFILLLISNITGNENLLQFEFNYSNSGNGAPVPGNNPGGAVLVP